jgi:hypothetical protein
MQPTAAVQVVAESKLCDAMVAEVGRSAGLQGDTARQPAIKTVYICSALARFCFRYSTAMR